MEPSKHDWKRQRLKRTVLGASNRWARVRAVDKVLGAAERVVGVEGTLPLRFFLPGEAALNVHGRPQEVNDPLLNHLCFPNDCGLSLGREPRDKEREGRELYHLLYCITGPCALA